MIETYDEASLPGPIREQLRRLLDEAFPDMFSGRIYFKQWPHRRLILREAGTVVAQVGIDDRIIRVGSDRFGISGLIDLCVGLERRGRGLASQVLQAAEARARDADIAFLIVMADRHDLYLRHGYRHISPAVTTWLAIEDRASVGLIERDLSDCFLAKALTDRPWPRGPIDLLGYLF